MDFRYDAGAIIKYQPQTTSDGFMRVYMRLAKAGEMTYYNADGTKRVEVVTPEELFKKDSYDTFKMLPLTLQHPPVLVTPDNAREYTRGSTGHNIVIDGEFLGIVGTIHDRQLINAVTNGDAKEVSPGYRVRPEARTDGKFLQRDRIGNHVAAVTKARGGEDVRFHLDGVDNFWMQQADPDSYRVDLDDEFINTLLERFDTGEIYRKTPINLPFREDAPRKWNAANREALANGEMKGGFAGGDPQDGRSDRSYPIASAADVGDAWGLAGQASNPDEIRRNIIRIARREGWLSGLPQTAREWAQQNNIKLDSKDTMPTQIPLNNRIFTVDGDDAPKLADAIATLQTEVGTIKTQLDSLTDEKAEIQAKLDSATSQTESAKQELQTKLDELQKERDRIDGELTAAKTRIDQAESSRMDGDAIATEIQARVDAWDLVLPAFRKDDATFKPDYKMDTAAIRAAYLVKVNPALKPRLDNATPEFIEGLWEGLKPEAGGDRVDHLEDFDNVLNLAQRNDMAGNGSKRMTENPNTQRRKRRPLPGMPMQMTNTSGAN